MATWIKVFFLLLQYGPTIWRIVREIIALINSMAAFMDDPVAFKQQARGRMDDCVAYYQFTGDKSKLEEMHGELSIQLGNLQHN